MNIKKVVYSKRFFGDLFLKRVLIGCRLGSCLELFSPEDAAVHLVCLLVGISCAGTILSCPVLSCADLHTLVCQLYTVK